MRYILYTIENVYFVVGFKPDEGSKLGSECDILESAHGATTWHKFDVWRA